MEGAGQKLYIQDINTFNINPHKSNIDDMWNVFKGRVERISFFASFKLPLFNEYEMVFIIA